MPLVSTSFARLQPCFAIALLLLASTTPAFAQKKPPLANPNAPKLSDLASQADRERFKLPVFEEGKITTAGIRKIEGKHLTIYTDVPDSPGVAELQTVFEAALPLWERYFGWPAGKLDDWKIVGCLIQDKERFLGSGLLPNNLPDFANGYARGSQFWWNEQPSDYYRRHLMLHEATHMVMDRFLGGMGPIWYMEGIAELISTHRWENNKLELAIMPPNRESVPYWGRVKMIRDGYAEQKAFSLQSIFRINPNEHFRPEMYGWAWGAATFLSEHPQTKEPFQNLLANTADRSIDFSLAFEKEIEPHIAQTNEDWQLFVADCDYGYDVARSVIVRSEVHPLPIAGESITLQTDRGWQSSGIQLKAGQEVEVRAKGRYKLRKETKPNEGMLNADWPCEPNGITIRYHRGLPLGTLLVAVGDQPASANSITPLAKPEAVGLAKKLSSTADGTLYFCINEPSSGLHDNEGTVQINVQPAK